MENTVSMNASDTAPSTGFKTNKTRKQLYAPLAPLFTYQVLLII